MKSLKAFHITGERQDMLQFLMQLDDLAFVRRARAVEETWQHFLEQCRHRRFHLLEVARARLAILRELIGGDWSCIASLLQQSEDAHYLQALHADWQATCRVPVRPTNSERKIRRALRDVLSSIERFNVQWSGAAATFDLSVPNRARLDYNRYYVVEKACAFGSEEIARSGFRPLDLLTVDHVLAEFPPLRVLQLR